MDEIPENDNPPPQPPLLLEEEQFAGPERAELRLLKPAHPLVVILIASLLLGIPYGLIRWLQPVLENQKADIFRLTKNADQMAAAKEHFESLKDLKIREVGQFKNAFSGVAKSNKDLFESGLSLQTERRLLEKQLEIMTTYLVINPLLQRIFLMRDGQPLQSYLISYIPLRSFPSAEVLAASSSTTSAGIEAPLHLPNIVRIVSKERFAHPERGKSEQVNGHLQYTPPQVGTSIRSNALGQFVMFTNSKLIIHGPPLNAEDHEKFPHICLGLDLEAARKLYRSSFIGTKIVLNSASVKR
jgi:hypothetical protein